MISFQYYECVDGESDDLKSKKIRSLATFNEGVKYYFDQGFPKASVAFEETLKMNPGDATALCWFIIKPLQLVTS